MKTGRRSRRFFSSFLRISERLVRGTIKVEQR
jgi:hypothetical protein